MAVLSHAVLSALRIKHDDALLTKRESMPKAAADMFSDRELALVTNANISLRELGDLLDTIKHLNLCVETLTERLKDGDATAPASLTAV